MQAIICRRWGGPEVLECAEMPTPTPGPRQHLVQVHYAALNPIDYKIRNGRFRWFMHRRFPKILGLEASGTLAHNGKRVFVLTSKGFAMGCYAEWVAVDRDFIFELPEAMEMAVGAGLAVAPATALQGLRDHGLVKTGSKVLINGASGSVGQCAVQIARILGAEVTGVCSARNLDLVKEIGAHRVIDYAQTDFTTEKEQYDLVFDVVSKRSFAQCRRVLSPRGRYLNLMLNPADLLFQKVNNLFAPQKFITFIMEYRASDLQWISERILEGRLRLPLDRTVPLADARAAHVYLESERAVGKILLETEAARSSISQP
jgi:NADPH:quinone reductase-like Zn-dependent oxidoreductase